MNFRQMFVIFNLVSKSNSNNSTLFVRVLYVSPDINFVSTNYKTFCIEQIMLRLDSSRRHIGI